MEYLDIYDENGKYLGKEDRNIVHRDALWHKTVHCWLYDNEGNIYFQQRKKEGTLYTTASGHILSGETVKEGFGREVLEELGVNIDYENAKLIEIVNFKMDRLKDDGTYFRDRAFANVYACEYIGNDLDFNMDKEELIGIAKVNPNDVLDLFNNNITEIKGVLIKNTDNKNIIEERSFKVEDFLLNKGETLIEKYGNVLKKVIDLTKM